jgi:hypothetical protein
MGLSGFRHDIYYTGADTHNNLEGNYLMQLGILEQYCLQTLHIHTDKHHHLNEVSTPQNRPQTITTISYNLFLTFLNQ